MSQISEIDPDKHFARIDGDGVFRVYNINTHEVVLEKNPDKCSKDFKNKFLPAPTPKLKAYHPFIGDLITEKILEGKTLRDISKDPMYPSYSVMMRWLTMSNDFLEKIQRAEKTRSRYYHDRIVEIANTSEAMNNDEIKQAKLQMEAFKWAATVGDAEKYGNKTQVQTDISTKTTIIIETGIRRDPLTIEEQRIIDVIPKSKKLDQKDNNRCEPSRIEGIKSKDDNIR